MKKFWYTKKVDTSFSEILVKLESVLKGEWFWILTRVDIKAKFKDALNEEIDDYMILWVCNPALAFEAISAEHEMWLLLPCNIIVYSKLNEIYVSTIIPTTAMNMVYNNVVNKVAEKAEKKLKKVVDNI